MYSVLAFSMFVRIACCFVKAAMSVFTLFTYTYTYTFIYIYIYLYICVLTGRLPLVREAHICSWVAGWLESGLASVFFFLCLFSFVGVHRLLGRVLKTKQL